MRTNDNRENPNIHFEDKTRIQKCDTVKYLGCNINQEGNSRKEAEDIITEESTAREQKETRAED